jgi:hypothetical protein
MLGMGSCWAWGQVSHISSLVAQPKLDETELRIVGGVRPDTRPVINRLAVPLVH